MIDLNTVPHNQIIEDIAELLSNKTQNPDKAFFRIEAAYFLAKIASCMRVKLVTKSRGKVPVNLYTMLLATSGYGKGHSVSIVENDLLSGFKQSFLNITLPQTAGIAMDMRATQLSIDKNTSQTAEREALEKEWVSYGAYPFTFDSGSTPAIKQLRQKLLLSNIGSINLQIDEIGSNLINNVEALNTFLELFDQGMVKQKLTKCSADSFRGADIDGSTPANMLLFGTPTKLLDGTSVEDTFYSLLDTGYARRTIFALGKKKISEANSNLTATDIFKKLINPENNAAIVKYHSLFEALANPSYANIELYVPDNVDIADIEYKLICQKKADELQDDTDAIKKSELEHRYFKALKLAGALAFMEIETLQQDQEGHFYISERHLYEAMKLVEESGEAFEKILHREKDYVRLAKFLSNQQGNEVTLADLTEKLPCFGRKTQTQQKQMITLAKGYGIKNNILITSRLNDDIELFKAKSLSSTNLDQMILSMSQSKFGDKEYFNQIKPWSYVCNTLPKLTLPTSQADNKAIHWITHHVNKGHRSEEDMQEKFNMIVLDIDTGNTLALAKELLKEYTYCIYTTKSHGIDGVDRYRIILPINYILEMDRNAYKEFMDNVLTWFPIAVDETSNQRSKKWLTNPNTQIFVNQGELLNCLQFIPKTQAYDSYRNQVHNIKNMTKLESWFMLKISKEGNRNNNLLRYAMALHDAGETLTEAEKKVRKFNKQLPDPLSDPEIENTILRSLSKRYI